MKNYEQQQQQRRQLSFDDPEIQMSIQRQRRQSQSSSYGDSAQQQQQQQEIQRGPSRSQEQQYYNNSKHQAMPPLMSQPQRPPMQPHYQNNNASQYYNTQQQQQQLHNHSQLASPRVIPSPPTVQRNNAASHPYPYDNNHMAPQHQPVHLMGEHSFEELEQSGIIRNNINNPTASHHPRQRHRQQKQSIRQPIMNRNHMAPSDEWDTSQQSKRVGVDGYTSDSGGQQQSRYNQQRSGAAAGHYQQPRLPRQPQSSSNNTSAGYNSDGGYSSSRPSPYNELRAAKQQYQMEQQRHQRKGPPPLMSPLPQLEHQPQQPQHYQQPRRSSPPRRPSPPRQAHGAVVSHFMRNHPSMQQGNSQRQQRDSSPQKQHTQLPQNVQPPLQQQQHSQQPNWNEVNRQRMYQRQAISKQQYQERQEHLHEQQQQLEKMEGEQRKLREKSRSPNRKKNIIPDSPVEHLGVRTDKIQRKNNIIVHHHANTAPSSAAGGRQRHPLPPPDDETISVASLRKGWEKSHSPADSKHTSRSRNTAPPSSSGHNHRHHDENSPFGVWTERSERLLRARHREQRREQRKNIEDRWRSNFRGGGAVQSLPSSPQRQRNNVKGHHQYDSGNDYGYQSEGERGGGRSQPERYDDGYQSEGQELVRCRNRYYDNRDDDYHQPAEEQQQEEVEYNPDQMMFEEVPDTITPQDARARLWDQNERLRAVLPQNEVEGMGHVKDRWSEHRLGDSVVSPRSNFSGSSGGRFKSKFVHAAAIATQQRGNMNEGNRGASYSPQRSQRHQQQQQKGNYEVSLSQHENLRRRDSSPHKRFNAHKGSMAVLSHYTDSTAETTTLDTNPSRSFGSSQRHQISNTSTTVRRVSPSPKSSSGQQQQAHPSSMMPPIAEQRASSEVGQSQVLNTTSVAALISRINAVSRSNPEEALAAIDSIIKTQHDTSTDTGHAVAPTQEVPPTPVKIASLFSPTRNETPPIVNNARTNKNKELHVGKDFFQQKYEEVLHSDSLQVIRNANAAVVRDRASFDNSPVEEEDDCGSFLSSEDSTVSSMTNPIYQSRRDHEREQKHRHQKKARSQEEPPDVEQKKSWNTLKREYHARKNSPVRGYSEEEELEVKQSHSRESRTTPRRKTRSHEEAEERQVNQTMTPSDEEDIGLDKFSSAIQDEPDEDSGAWRQQIPLVESKDLSTGMCGMAFTKSGSKYSAAEDNSDLVDNDAWVSHDAAAFGNTSHSRREAQSKHRQDKKDPRPHPPTAPLKKLDNYLADNRTSSSKKAQVSHQSRQSKLNKRASPPPLEHPPKARASTPEIMKSMSDAFSNLDISLEATTAHRPSQDFYNNRPSHNEEYNNDDPPLQTFESDPEDKDNPQSLKSISEAFSDVGTNDIFAQQEKTSSQRRKQLEYLAKSWTADSSGSPNFNGGKKSSLDNTFAQQHKATEAADWAKETFKSNNTSKQKKIKKSEPSLPLRLKGNKSLASKFASLVKAYDD